MYGFMLFNIKLMQSWGIFCDNVRGMRIANALKLRNKSFYVVQCAVNAKLGDFFALMWGGEN